MKYFSRNGATGGGAIVIIIDRNTVAVYFPARVSIQESVSEKRVFDQMHLIKLHEFLNAHFDEEELKTLCFKLRVPYDSLPAQGKVNKARELVQYLDRHGRIPELEREIAKQRPQI